MILIDQLVQLNEKLSISLMVKIAFQASFKKKKEVLIFCDIIMSRYVFFVRR